MKNLNWFQARDLAYQGKAVRRDAWRQWLTHSIALYFIDRADAATGNALHYVVNNYEFGAAEFLANDWTDEPWPGGGTPPSNPIVGNGGGSLSGGPPVDGGSSSGDPSSGGPVSGGGTSSGPGGGTSGPPANPKSGAGNWGSAANPPDPTSVWQYYSGGGSSGPPPSDPAPFKPPNNPPTNQTPTITVTIVPPNFDTADFDEGQNCFMGGQDAPRYADLTVGVQIAGGPPGVGTLRIQLGSQSKSGMTGWPGMNNNGIDFSNFPYSPGGQITGTAYYTINGVTYNGTTNYTFPDWCSGYPVGEV